MELTAAFIAAQREGDPRRRIWVVNPATNTTHIEPIELRDEQHAVAPKSPEGYTELAERVVEKIVVLNSCLGGIIPLTPPQHYGQKLVSARHFIGRLPDLWRVHSALHGAESAIISGESTSGLAQVSGMGGLGKSLLAEEYAIRFGGAYPGGIFWLRGLGNDTDAPTSTAEQQNAVRQDQFHYLAVTLGVPVKEHDTKQIEAMIGAKLSNANQPFLWIVDDLASGLTNDVVRAWLAPHSLGKTLFTTRSREYESIGNHVPLDVLSADEAFDLLQTYRKPEGPDEDAAARGIAKDLGFHPLALAVCSRALEAEAGLRSFVEFRQSLSDTQHDELELAAELSGVLPNGHEKSVAATLLRSVRALKPEGLDFLRLASLLAAAPIPPSLVAATFAAADELDGSQARRRAALGFTQAENACLAGRAQNNAINVHALISRTVRFHDLDRNRNQQLRTALVATLSHTLPAVADIRSHQRLSLEVLHAREIASRGIHDAETATLALRVARHDSERGAYVTARLLQEQVVAVRSRILGMEHPDTLTAMNNLALTLGDQGDLSGARSLQEQVLATQLRLLGEEHPKTQSSITNLAATLRIQGDFASARKLQEQALATRRRVLGEEHPDTLTAMHSLALTLRAQGDLASARTLQEQVLATRHRIFGEGHPDILSSMNNLAGTLRAQRDLTNARGLQEQVLTISRRIFGEQHPHTLTAMNNLAMTLSDQGDLSGARSLQEQVLATCHLLLGAEHPNTLTAMHNLAMTLTNQDDLRGARLLQQQVLASRYRILGAEHPDTTSAEWNLFITLSASGDRVAAISVRQKLYWLLQREPSTLSDTQRQIREQFQQILDAS
jgi:hypothetical protein